LASAPCPCALPDALPFLALALGERADAGVLRAGAARADVSAVFDPPPHVRDWLAERDLDTDAELVLRRVIGGQGRSKAYINGLRSEEHTSELQSRENLVC